MAVTRLARRPDGRQHASARRMTRSVSSDAFTAAARRGLPGGASRTDRRWTSRAPASAFEAPASQ